MAICCLSSEELVQIVRPPEILKKFSMFALSVNLYRNQEYYYRNWCLHIWLTLSSLSTPCYQQQNFLRKNHSIPMHTAIQKCFTLTLALRSLLSLCNQQQKVSFRTSCETLSSGKDTFDDDNLFVHLYNSFKDHNSAFRKRCTASALCVFEILGKKYFANL